MAVVAPAPILDLFDLTSTINGGTQSRCGAECRSLSAARHQRAACERRNGDVDEKKFSHRVLLMTATLRFQVRHKPRLTTSPHANARRALIVPEVGINFAGFVRR
jgi:hypothetical protein